jgi:DNA repair protein RadC
MHLDIRGRVNMVELVSLGSLSCSIIHPREAFRRAVIHGSASIIVGHNRPSGELDPSHEDMRVTKILMDAGKVLGIDMVDHIVFTDDKFFSSTLNSIQALSNTEKEGDE